ncbi:hypothetical protein CTAYLR_000165 [Chrysophaeum taylorii]|uniref:PNPLA domain-containing protein n=1 Tax=Chrysophaeum taylorii TaxID=2483200 RepID=A0AAD7UGP4_9STRA|nr:hypothetical protein CTAYLR_000165 [Chrysophaeum taylorii]
MASREKDGLRVLCLDGGGVKGLATLQVLKKLEEIHGPLHEIFDVIAGTSTGSLIAAGIAARRLSCADMEAMYEALIPAVFTTGFASKLARAVDKGEFQDSTAVEAALQNEFGECGSLASLGTKPALLVIASKRTDEDSGYAPRVFSSYDKACDVPVWQALRCSTAANFYFQPFQIGDTHYRDGGLVANNPTKEVLRLLLDRDAAATPKIAALVSLGTGSVAAEPAPQPAPRSRPRCTFVATASEATADWSRTTSEHARALAVAASSLPYPGLDVDATHQDVIHLISVLHPTIIAPSRYIRLQPRLDFTVKLDDASRAALDHLIQAGATFADEVLEDLEDIPLS